MKFYIKSLYISLALFFFGSSLIIAQTNNSDEKAKFDFFFYNALKAKSNGDYASSFDLLNYCHAIDSTNATVLYELGNYYRSMKNKDLAYEMYKKSSNLESSNYYFGLAYINQAMEMGKLQEAIVRTEALTKLYPTKSTLLIYLADEYKMNKENLKSIETLNKLEKIIGLNEQLSLQKYELYKDINQEEKAYAEIKQYIEKYPLEIKYYILLGDLYLQGNRPDDALAFYETARKIDAKDPYLIMSLATYYESIGDKKQAEKELQQAIVSPDLDIMMKLNILAQYATNLQEKNVNITDANALFDSLLIIHPQEPRLNLIYGNLLLLQNDKEAARTQYQLYTDANPNQSTGWEQLLMTVYPSDLDATIDVTSKAIKILPDEPQFYYYQGLAYALKDNYKKGLSVLKEGVKKTYANYRLKSDFYQQIGDFSYHLNQVEDAFAAYENALKYNPNNLGVLNNYSYYLSTLNQNLNKAERMSALTVKAEPFNPTYLDTYGWILYQQGDYVLAKSYLEKAVENAKSNPQLLTSDLFEHYGDVLKVSDESVDALDNWIKALSVASADSTKTHLKNKINPLLDSLVTAYPDSLKFNLFKAELYSLDKEKEKALDEYKVYLEGNSTDVDTWLLMLNLAFPDSSKLAVEIMNEALIHLPKDPIINFYGSLAYVLDDNYNKALEILNNGIANLDGSNVYLSSEYFRMKGDILTHLEQVDSSFVAYDKAIEFNSSNVLALNNYAYALSEASKDLDKALKMSYVSIQNDPENATYLDTYAWILFKNKDYVNAEKYMKKALEFAKEDNVEEIVVLEEHYGDILAMLGNTDEALAYWEKALKRETEKKDRKEMLRKKIDAKKYIEDKDEK